MAQVDDFRALLSDFRQNEGSPLGTPFTVKYAFLTTSETPSLGQYQPYANDGYSGFSSAQRASFRTATALFEAVSGIRYVEVDDPDDASLKVMRVQGASIPGWATWTRQGTVTSSYVVIGKAVSYEPGTYEFETILHELGHNAGLKHPFDGSTTLTANLDNQDHTLMSYTHNFVNDTDLAHLDKDALQYIYGPATFPTTIKGSNADDILLGHDTHDKLIGKGGDDELYGEGGKDRLYGDSGDDLLRGGSGKDKLYGGDGDDKLDGDGGDDRLYGGDDDDFLKGGSGDDKLYGDGGKDRLFGESGDDLLDGGSGSDKLYGDDGEDKLYGRGGKDKLYGDADADKIYGGSGDDTARGGSGKDKIYGENGDDKLYGDSGWDFIEGGRGNDRLYGNSGADTFHFNKGDDKDTIKDFENNRDVIELDNFNFSNVADALAKATQEGDDVVFYFGGGDKLTVEDITIVQLSNDIDLV